MGVYYMNEAAFDLPELGFIDKTVNVLEARPENVGEVGLLISRAPLLPGKSLRDVLALHVAHEKKTLKAYSLVFERDTEIAGFEAIEVGCRWRGESGMLYTRQAHLVASKLWLLIAANTPFVERARCDEYMDKVLGTLRFRD